MRRFDYEDWVMMSRHFEPSLARRAPINDRIPRSARCECASVAKGQRMNKSKLVFVMLLFLGGCFVILAVESGMYRLLSVSDTEKLILVSQIPSKTKYLLDASSAKITLNGKPAEFKELKSFSIIQVKIELNKKLSKNGIGLDGSASEIKISSTEKSK